MELQNIASTYVYFNLKYAILHFLCITNLHIDVWFCLLGILSLKCNIVGQTNLFKKYWLVVLT